MNIYPLFEIEGCPSWGPGPVYGRGSKTQMLLWLENKCCRIEAWQSCPNQGRHFSREEEDQGQVGGQTSWGRMSDHDRHPLIQSEGPFWKFTCPTLQLAPPCCIRSWCSLVCGHPPSMGWMYQSHPVKPTPKGSDSKTMPQEDDGLPITQHQARNTSWGG